MPPLPAADAAPDVSRPGKPGGGSSRGVRVVSAALPEDPVSMLLVEISLGVGVHAGANGFAPMATPASRAEVSFTRDGVELSGAALVDGTAIDAGAEPAASDRVVVVQVRLPPSCAPRVVEAVVE